MPRIIVVDDDLSNTSLIKMLLELDGFTVEACANLPAVRSTTTADTAVFVVDYHLARGENGLDVIRAVRDGETAASPDAVVIVTSGDHRREDEALQAGADLFLSKPYPPSSLSQEIDRLLSKDQ